MKYSEAKKHAKEGKRICRKSWIEKGIYVFSLYSSVLCFEEDNFEEYYNMSECNSCTKIGVDENEMFRLENILLLKTENETIKSYEPCLADILNEDWILL